MHGNQILSCPKILGNYRTCGNHSIKVKQCREGYANLSKLAIKFKILYNINIPRKYTTEDLTV